MAYLFSIEDKVVFPNTETLLISPFKEIWERDKTKHKDKAIQEFTFIEFMTSQLSTNPYKGYSEKVRYKVLSEEIFKVKEYKPDKLVKEAMNVIIKFQKEASETYKIYETSVKAKETLEDFLSTLNLSKTNNQGSLLYKPADITKALLDLDKVAASLSKLKQKVEEELFEATKTKGDKVISPFAKPESLIE